MSRYTEILNLNTDEVRNIADAYTGYAQALSARPETPTLPFVASCWLIGALYKSILFPQGAMELFARAARAYRQLGMPIWRLCSICAQNSYMEGMDSKEIPHDTYDEEDLFYANLQRFDYSIQNERKSTHNWNNENEQEYSGRIPGLNIPYRLVMQVLNDIQHIYTNDFFPLRSFSDLLIRLAELTELYQSDQYHWEHLQGEIVPFEPAALAIVIVVLKKLLLTEDYDIILSRLSELNRQQKVLLDVAHDIIQPYNDF